MRAFNAFYYSFSPAVAGVVNSNPALGAATRVAIYPLIQSLKLASMLNAILPIGAEASIVAAGVLASVLIGLIYVTPILLMIKVCRRRR